MIFFYRASYIILPVLFAFAFIGTAVGRNIDIRWFLWNVAWVSVVAYFGNREKKRRESLYDEGNVIVDRDGVKRNVSSVYAALDLMSLRIDDNGRLVDNFEGVSSLSYRKQTVLEIMRNEKMMRILELKLRRAPYEELRSIRDSFCGMWLAFHTQASELSKVAQNGQCDKKYASEMIAQLIEARDGCVAVDAFCKYLQEVEKVKGTWKYVKNGIIENHLHSCLWRAKNVL